MFRLREKHILILLLLFVVLFGTFGYKLIEGWSFLDSFYMTMITLTTTGYQEVAPLSEYGRIFTICLLLVGVGTVAYSASFFMNDFFSSHFGPNRRKSMDKKINKLEGHTILCGFGRMGQVIAKEFSEIGVDFVVIDTNKDNIEDFRQLGYLYVDGDATKDETLLEAGIEKAKTLATVVGNDSENLYVVLAAKDLNPKVTVVSRASDEDAKAKIMRAGANRVVMPLAVSAHKVAHTIANPAVEDYLEITGVQLSHDERIQMADLEIDNYPSLLGKSLLNCGLKREGMIVLGVKQKAGNFLFAPESTYCFEAGDTLITLSTPEHFDQILENLA
jgi:voltage-gated potassium channel